jgi:hypothetical protein
MNALSPIALLINHRRWKYRWRYLLGQTPWETDETSAEVLEFIVRNLARILRPGAWFMLYAWLPWMNHGKPRGISPETVEKLFRDGFSRSCFAVGEEKGRASAGYWYQRRLGAQRHQPTKNGEIGNQPWVTDDRHLFGLGIFAHEDIAI